MDSPLWLLLGATVLQVLLVTARLALVAGLIEAEGGLALEMVGSLLVLGALLWLGADAFGVWGAAFVGVPVAVAQVLLSLGLTALADVTIGWGEEDVPLPLDYPLLAAFALLVITLPRALGGGLLAGLSGLYWLYLVAAVLSYAAYVALEPFGEEWMTQGVLYLLSATASGGLYLLAAGRGTPGRALMAAALATGLGSALQLLLSYYAARLELGDELDPVETPRRAVIFGGSGLAAILLLFLSRLVSG